MTPSARRATLEAQDTPSTGRRRWPLGRGWAVVLAVAVLSLLVLGLSFVYQGSNDTVSIVVPAPTSDQTSPSTEETTLNPPSVLPGSPSPTFAPTITDPSQSDEAEPTGTAEAGDIQLNDARFTAPEGWLLAGDEQIENSRRVVRLSQQDTDSRLQAVTLEPSEQGLGAACTSLMDFQKAQFTNVENQLVTPIGVDATLGSAVRCGFDGTRSSDGVNNTVTFTLVQRTVDSHVLMLRTTVPEGASDAPAVVGQLNGMACGASSSFGVSLPLC